MSRFGVLVIKIDNPCVSGWMPETFCFLLTSTNSSTPWFSCSKSCDMWHWMIWKVLFTGNWLRCLLSYYYYVYILLIKWQWKGNKVWQEKY